MNMNNKSNEHIYELTDTVTYDVVQASSVVLNEYEAEKFNYAFAANGSTLRYLPTDEETEVELFKFVQPI